MYVGDQSWEEFRSLCERLDVATRGFEGEELRDDADFGVDWFCFGLFRLADWEEEDGKWWWLKDEQAEVEVK